MNQEDFVAWVGRRLETAGIAFMVAGSHGSGYHGQPRATNDVDFVIDPTAEQLDQFLAALSDDYYASPEAAHEALRNRSVFNVIHLAEGWKADLIIHKNRPFSVEEFARRQVGNLYGHPLPIASAEDVILSKLEWHRISPSERQLQDALHVAVVQSARLDQPYLRHWAAQLGVGEQLEEILRQAEALRPPPNPTPGP
jgi:hypothetical protein